MWFLSIWISINMIQIENEKFTCDFQFWIHLIIRRQWLRPFGRRSACLRPTPKNQHARELLLALWVFRTSPNMDRVIGSWLGLLNNHHMIKNTELEFEHRTDIACDKLERILLPPYILIESRGGKWWTFCNLGAWFWSNFSANRLYERKDTWKYKFDSVMSYWKENFDPSSSFAYN